VRPEAVAKMDNLYTSTVYEKGAEVVRLYETVLGAGGFRAGMDLYFKRHDGSAVTCDDFYAAMADANAGAAGAAALPALKRWYAQAGTPAVTVTPAYDASARTLTLRCAQRTPATPGAPAESKVPVLIPIAAGLLSADGAPLPVTVAGGAPGSGSHTATLLLADAAADFVLTGVPPGAVPSLLRGFSAPVRLTVVGQTDADLSTLLLHDADPFNRWEAAQVLGRAALLRLYAAAAGDGAAAAAAAAPPPGAARRLRAAVDAALAPHLAPALAALAAGLRATLADARLDAAFQARALALPAETELVDALGAGAANPLLVHAVRGAAGRALADALRAPLEGAVRACDAAIAAAQAQTNGYSPEFAAAGRRALRNRAAAMLAAAAADAGAAAAALAERAAAADNATDRAAALAALCDLDDDAAAPHRERALAAFHDRFAAEPLVLLKWLGLQAGAARDDTTAAVRALQAHADFHLSNPNACYSLFGAFAAAATPAFHAADGSGYALIADAVAALDALNPQVAARIVTPLTRLAAYDAPRQALMRAALRRLADGKLSANVAELVCKAMQ
jgi:aminopeptidase N